MTRTRNIGGRRSSPPVNKKQMLKSLVERISSVPVRKIRVSVDRIQFSLFYPDYDRKNILSVVDHIKFRPIRGRDQLLYISHLGRTPVQLVFKEHGWVEFSLSQPTEYAQGAVPHLLHFLLKWEPNRKSYLTQVEFAVDIYPEDPEDWLILKTNLVSKMVRKSARANSFKVFEGKRWDTCYFATNGDIRQGSYGVRVYKRPKESNKNPYVRVELLAHNGLLGKAGIDISSLPLRGGELCPFDFVDFRQPLTPESRSRLLDAIRRKQLERFPRQAAPSQEPSIERTRALRERFRRQCMADFIGDKMSDCPGIWDCCLDGPPVAHQISVFKELKKRYGLSHSVDYFFPKIV